MIKICPICGKEFEQTSSAQKMCSAECAKRRSREWHREYKRRDFEEQVCVVCGKPFIPKSIRQITCGSPECMKGRDASLTKERRRKEKKREPKPDTIIAIGYAERQMANTMAKVPPIRVEL